jgi:hypothetical protein
MRILGSFFGILLLSSIGVISRASAQANQQMSGSTMDAQVPAEDYGPSTGQPQTKQEEASTPTRKTPANNKDDDGDAGSDRRIHVRLGPIALGAGYEHFSGPTYYPYEAYPYPEYSAAFYPYWGQYPFFAPEYFAYDSAKGEVKLSAEPKTAEVYLDKAYAGTAEHLRSIWLEPGAYDLSLQSAGRAVFHQRIYVLSGKSLRITARLAAEAKPGDAKD